MSAIDRKFKPGWRSGKPRATSNGRPPLRSGMTREDMMSDKQDFEKLETESTGPLKVKYVRPWLYPKQLAAIFCDERYALIEASTKSGKTHGCIVWACEQAMKGKAGQNVWWVAPIFAQTKIAFRRLKRALPREVFTYNEGEMTITLGNGATIWFKSADNPDSLYGEDVIAAVIDEASRCKEDSWHAVRSTLTHTRGPIRMIGNVNGRKNWFYRMCRQAEGGEPNMRYSKLTWQDAVAGGIMKSEEVEDARRRLPAAVFKELFEADSADDGGNPFGLDFIAANIAELSERPPHVWGWDLAKKSDWCVGIALDAEGMVCRFLRFQKPWQDTIQTILRETGRTRALVDSTGVGDPILEALQADGRRNFTGYTFTSPSKQKLMEGLSMAIQRRSIRYPEGAIVNELEVFEYEYTRTGVRYSAPPGLNDDCVCALALAVEHYSTKPMRVGAICI